VEKKESRRSRIEKLRGQLDVERASFISHWRQLGDVILPRRPKFTVTDRNKGDRRSRGILDGTATLSLRTLKNGMMAGMTNPSRPWFSLAVLDRGLAGMMPVRMWLHEVTLRMRDTMARSNFYKIMPLLYGDMGTFGTGAMGIQPDEDNVVRFSMFPVGSYWIANDELGRVRTFVREFQMTVRQVVHEYATSAPGAEPDWSRVSERVKTAYQRGEMEGWVTVIQAITPNEDHRPDAAESKFKRFYSCHYEIGEKGTDYGEDRFLRESGFDIFPILAARWEVNDGDAYGTSCPGMDALPDIKQLQRAERRGLQAIDKMVSPAVTAPPELRGQKISQLPGDVTYYASRGGQKIETLARVDYRLDYHESKQNQVRGRIEKFFHADAFRAILDDSRQQPMTARQVQEIHEEKLIDLIPVLEQSNQDVFDPLIDLVFNYMLEAGEIPDPPQELEGQPLRVDYISIMAQAQKLVSVAGMERFVSFVGNLANQVQQPELLDKVNFDKMIEEYGDGVSAPPTVMRDAEEVAAIRQGRQRQLDQQVAAEQARAMAGTVKDLASSPTGGDTALSRVMDAMGREQ